MKGIFKRIIALGVIGSLALGISGCSVNKTKGEEEPKKTIIRLATDIDGDYLKELIDWFNVYYPHTIVEARVKPLENITDKEFIKNEDIDVIYGLDKETFQELKEKNLLKPYKSSELDNIKDEFKEEEGYYTGVSKFTPVIAYNKELLKKEGLPEPKEFKDLLKEEYKGYIISPDLEETYVGRETVRALGLNDEKLLRDNLNHEKQVYHGAAEELTKERYPMVIVPDYEGLFLAWDDEDVNLIYNKEGNFNMEGVALINKKEVKKEAQEFIDFVLSLKGMEVMSKNRAILSREGVESIMLGSNREEYSKEK
ncbi:extracellular solute-binding protein [Clostridium sp.]|uniref:extracellular solute-binding protein n=1 Tax=Clostridium sp. TaxID=1506 RepID=UPI003464C55F